MATDLAGNTGTCEFSVVISPQECENPTATSSISVNNTKIEDPDKQIRMLSVIWCSNDDYVFTHEVAPFYVW